ncbi:hypothetical protein IAU60_001654 [Kwoniella sp. DSM 27419]
MLLHLLSLASVIPGCFGETTTPNTGDQAQAFFFGFSSSNLVLPVVSPCPTPLSLSPLTSANAATSDPKAPYTMVMLVHEQLLDGAGHQYERLYSASLNVGDMSRRIDIAHPWMNGTQFIACIWASNGASGGCQDLQTVVPSELTVPAYSTPGEGCRADNIVESWVPSTNATLEVDVTGLSGAVSWNAWPAACSDLMVTPKNGTPPYTMLVAPAAHPPINITSASSGDTAMNYTIRLSHGQAFMLSVYDSAGASWAYGPLHAGTSDDLACMASNSTIGRKGFTASTGMFAGVSIGSFAVGCLSALLAIWCCGRSRRQHEQTALLNDMYANPRPASFRTVSSSTQGKPVSPIHNPGSYFDSPRLEYDTPATLCDPLLPGPMGGYLNSPMSPRKAIPVPPSLSETYGLQSGSNRSEHHRDSMALSDFRPTSTFSPPSTRERPASLPSVHRISSNEMPLVQVSPSLVQDSTWPRHSSPRATARPSNPALPAFAPASPRPTSLSSARTPIQEDEGSPPPSPSSRRRRNVYVVHSDGGAGDVHIQLPDTHARVIELPPDYQPAVAESEVSLPDTGTRAAGQTTSPGLPKGASPPVRVQRNSGAWAVGGGGETPITKEELRARAEAAMAEKSRPVV